MIKVVPDTNVLVSGMLGIPGCSRKVINFALAKRLVMCGSSASYNEFLEKLRLRRLQRYFSRQYFSQEKIAMEYKLFINQVDTKNTYPGVKITRDPDDDEFFRIAKASGASIIISRDKDVLAIPKYDDTIVTVTPEKFLECFYRLPGSRFT